MSQCWAMAALAVWQKNARLDWQASRAAAAFETSPRGLLAQAEPLFPFLGRNLPYNTEIVGAASIGRAIQIPASEQNLFLIVSVGPREGMKYLFGPTCGIRRKCKHSAAATAPALTVQLAATCCAIKNSTRSENNPRGSLP
jgi:hypothetical protein